MPETGEYAHTAVTMICTPDGRLSRYLYGVEYDQQTLRLSLLEASEGKIGTPMEQFLLFCFQYDCDDGQVRPVGVQADEAGGDHHGAGCGRRVDRVTGGESRGDLAAEESVESQ